jgi:hypothetical protein
VKLLLDEMYSYSIAEQLRDRGHDVLSVHERDEDGVLLEGSTDPEVLAAAYAAGRGLVTDNARDFRPLEADTIARGGHYAGIIYTSNRQFPRGEPGTTGLLVRALAAVLEADPDLNDRSLFLARAG